MSVDLTAIGSILAKNAALTCDFTLQLLAESHRTHLTNSWKDAQLSLQETRPRDLQPEFESYLNSLESPYGANEAHYSSFLDLPPLTKRMVSLHPSRYIVKKHALNGWAKTTSGTTGAPAVFVYSPLFYLEECMLSVRKIVERTNLALSPNRLSTLLFCSDTHKRRDTLHGCPVTGDIILQMQIVASSGHTSIDRVMQAWHSARPSLLASRPELLHVISQHMTEAGKTFDPQPDAIISSGSCLTTERRELIADAFKCPIIEVYATTEFGVLASRPDGISGFIPVDDSALWEVICDGRIASAGHGRLVLSSLRNQAMPLLRYDTGDIATISIINGRPCMAELKDNNRRVVPCWRLDNGRLVAPTALNRLSQIAGVKGFTAGLSSDNTVQIDAIVTGTTMSEKHAAQEALRNAAEEALALLELKGNITMHEEAIEMRMPRYYQI